MYSNNTQQKILDTIPLLSEQQLQVVLQFIQSLQPKTMNDSHHHDPLENFIGANHYGNLATAIDEELYA
ncbi:hypothetical protein VB712_17810 [Spirulina sp. CCNP1310]|uniref:hypothetical protein n=1 Tax=Spirulina sp. CCNP1310 TaxID=3110249 RepID=UPI002B204261|nr:hypothetical protein [Spirulina sp. CCNP1310]MEA5421085.1 hypothetical protein [Spirulina sp. CCNP1310]